MSLFGEARSSAGRGPARPASPADGKPTQAAYQIIDSLAALDAIVAELAAAGRSGAVVVDVETTSVDPMAADLVGIALTASEGKGYYIPVGHQPATSNLHTGNRDRQAQAGAGRPRRSPRSPTTPTMT